MNTLIYIIIAITAYILAKHYGLLITYLLIVGAAYAIGKEIDEYRKRNHND